MALATFALTMLMDLVTRKDWVHCVAWLSPDGGAHSAGRRGCSQLAVGYAHNDWAYGGFLGLDRTVGGAVWLRDGSWWFHCA